MDNQRTHWLNTVEFPFERKTFSSADGHMHYVDVGSGRPILFLHGCPTWSFLYRKLVIGLSGEFRCIAIDHLGLGLSDKPKNADYRPRAHVDRLTRFTRELDLQDVTIVGHDFGGSIGMNWASENRDRVRDAVFFNTWLWSLHKSRVIRHVAHTTTGFLNQFWFRLINPSPKFYLPILFADHHRLPKWVQDQFQLALNNQFETFCPAALAREMVSQTGWFEHVAEEFRKLNIPCLLVWGEDDETYGHDSLARMCRLLPNAASVTLPGVGNYVTEEAPDACIQHLRSFIS